MSDILRAFAVRNPRHLPVAEIERIAIESHPERFRSRRFTRWLRLCRAGDRSELLSSFTEFLVSDEAVRTLDDLANPWPERVRSLLGDGRRAGKERIRSFLDRWEARCEDGRPAVAPAFTAVADTLLALAFVRRLGRRGDLDHQAALRALALVERLEHEKALLSPAALERFLDRPVVLPSCFLATATDPAGSPANDRPGEPTEPREEPPGCKSDGDCRCVVNDECVEHLPGSATIRPYVVDLMVVRSHTECYRPGDLSFVRNVMAGESLSVEHRRLERTEEVREAEEEQTRFSERDLQVEDEAALHKEIEETVKDDRSFEAGVTATASWGLEVASYGLEASSSFSSQQSSELTRKEVRDYARNVVDRAIDRLEQKVRTSARSTQVVETEETNDHSFENVTDSHVSGQYLYVDKVSRAQLFNHGKRAVVEIFLPEPAALYRHLLTDRFEGLEPMPPAELDLSPSEITADNYAALAVAYGLENVPEPLAERRQVEATLEGEPGDPKGKNKHSGSRTFTFGCTIPPDYEGIEMSVHVVRLNYNQNGGVSITATLGPDGSNVWHRVDGSSQLTSSLPSIEGSHSILVHTWDVTNFTWVLTVECRLKAEVMESWQRDVYGEIVRAWEARREEYERARQEFLEQKAAFELEEEARTAERARRDPFFNREAERTELKRMAISYVSGQFFGDFDAMKQRVKPCGFPEMEILEAEREGRFVRFFEHAFEWSLMTYVFYPYFWGRKCTWEEKVRAESGDPLFQRFLGAGSARVLVPIRDGFLPLVQYFLATGEIWGSGGTPPLPDDPHYVSVAQEIKEQQENYSTDRVGTIDATEGSPVVILRGTDEYWSYADPVAQTPGEVNEERVAADLDREIFIDRDAYRIVEIRRDPGAGDPDSWRITLDREYEGETAQGLAWSTGAVFVGAPWRFVTPTALTVLRKRSECLPCYPLEECEEEPE